MFTSKGQDGGDLHTGQIIPEVDNFQRLLPALKSNVLVMQVS